MAKKPSTEKRQPWECDFLHVELDAAQKKAVQTWDPSGDVSILCLENHMLAGCKLTVVHDTRNDCRICSLTTAKVEGGERQLCISARGPDLVAAVRVLAYKIEKILDGDLSSAREVAEARSQWG